jgi:hypothetical protein
MGACCHETGTGPQVTMTSASRPDRNTLPTVDAVGLDGIGGAGP